MSLNVKEVRKANEEYYNSTYISKIHRYIWGFFAVLILMGLQCIVLKIRKGMLEKIYYLEAQKQSLNGIEVSDWVNQKVGAVNSHDLAMAVIIIAIVGLLFILLSCYLKKGYDIYKQKRGYLILITGIYFSEIVIVIAYYVNAYRDYLGNIFPEFIFKYIILFLIEALNQGLLMSLDMKVPIRINNLVIKILFGWNNKVMEKLLDRL